MSLRDVGDDPREGGLARTGWSAEDDGGKDTVSFDGTPQETARTDDMVLSDDLVKGLRAHAISEGGVLAHILLHLVVKEVHGGNYIARKAGYVIQ